MKKILLLIMSLSIITFTNAKELTLMHGPGGANDNVARMLISLKPLNHYTIISRPGAGGRIAVNHMKNNDSVVFITAPQIFVNNVLIDTSLNYNPDTLKIVAVVGYMPSVLLCNKNSNIKTIDDIRKSTKILNFGVAGIGSNEHISTRVLFYNIGDNRHSIVPYATAGNAAFISLLGGHIDCQFANYPTVKRLLPNNNLNIIMSTENLNLNVPVWQSIFKNEFPIRAYLAMVLPDSSPQINEVQTNFKKAFSLPDVSDMLLSVGLIPDIGTDQKLIDRVHTANQQIKNFIINNKIDITQ